MKHRVGPYSAVKTTSRDKKHPLFALFRPDIAHKETESEKEFLEMLGRSKYTIFNICLHFTDRHPDNIRDLYQEIVCTLWEAWPDFQGKSATDTWVRRIALNVAVTQVRSQRKLPTFIPLVTWMYDTIADDGTDTTHDYFMLLNQLDPDEMELLYLRLDHFSMKEIADTLLITEAAVKQRLYRIRKKMDNLKKTNDSYD